MEKLHLVIYKDGTLQAFFYKQDTENHQDKARFFEVAEDFSINNIIQCSMKLWNLTSFSTEFNQTIKEYNL